MVTTPLPPRVVIAAPASGQGKTTVATGLMAALTAAGHRVAPYKVGPDYIDPGYHSLASGRPGRNLDPILCPEDLVLPLFLHGSRDCDVAVVEGVMGLFDGRLGSRGEGSTAHIARLLDAPVVLVVDVRHSSRSVGAVVAGMAGFDPRIRIAGVVLNQVGSERHASEVCEAVSEVHGPGGEPVRVLGLLPRSLEIEAPSRHLGLVPAAERTDAGIRTMGKVISHHLDLAAILEVAQSAPARQGEVWDPGLAVKPPPSATGRPPAGRPRVAIAGGRAFTFRYPETDELLLAGGCEPVVVDPLQDTRLPDDISGLWLGGGFPEVHATDLANNESLREDIARRVGEGLPTVAECAGLLYLCERVEGEPMVGAIPTTAAMGPKLTMGYRRATAPRDSLLGRAGETVTGHEFHRTTLADQTGLLPAWELDGRAEGVATPSLHASYLHVHWAGHPQLAQRFINAVHQHAHQRLAADPDLWHHGDQDAAAGLVDFAVNVRASRPPQWLLEQILADLDWGSYPDPRAARAAIARHHGVGEEMVLPTAGAAEAFTLVARALPPAGGSTRGRPWRSLVVHPQFTEPEAALLAAGHRPVRHLLSAADGFQLQGALVPHADLIVVGNPTNPTGVLHPLDQLLALDAGVLVVDEAFLDILVGAPESIIAPDMSGRLALRSLTKTWSLAGLRAGYVVGDPALIELLARQQPPWSVSSPALAATVACLSAEANQQADRLAREAAHQRRDLVARLHRSGLPTVPGRAPFVLVDTRSISTASLREPLAERGFAVRRGETFPGLGPTWLRLAARSPEVNQRLVETIAGLKEDA